MQYYLTLQEPVIIVHAAPCKIGAAGLLYRQAMKLLNWQVELSLSHNLCRDNDSVGRFESMRAGLSNTLFILSGLILPVSHMQTRCSLFLSKYQFH